MKDNLKMRLVRAPWYRGCEILILSEDERGVVVNMELKEREIGTMTESSLNIDDKSAQTLMDDLWTAGFRPTEGSGSAGSLKATENHLNDFRKIVAKTLDIDLK